tara:strand:+ start:241 stop:441 length:201 start_codon:yes stop_codon:yes gene_type:complete
MGLLENEHWEDYLNEEVYVTANHGMSGFLGTLVDYNNNQVLVKDNKGTEHELKHEYVYGTWILEDW